MNKLIELNNISKSFKSCNVLNNISLNVYEKDMIAIVGKSGSGKSTLLNIMGLFLKPDSGKYFIQEKDADSLKEKETAKLRNSFFGFVVQDFALIDGLSVYQNIMIPINYLKSKKEREISKSRINGILKSLDIYDKKSEPVYNLSGGQKQRAAIARALVNDPKIILADEPTGALDSKNALSIMNIFKELNNAGRTIILVTHDNDVANTCNKIISISDGNIYVKE